MLGVPADQMSDVTTLLFGPAMAGTEVSVRMSILDKKTTGDLVKLMIFILVTTLATGVLVVADRQPQLHQSTRDYKAVFSDATGVVKGDDIRIAGVKVGSVKESRSWTARTRWSPSTSPSDSAVTKSPRATIRYRNLVGQRYISLTQGVGDLDRLPRTPRSRWTAPSRRST